MSNDLLCDMCKKSCKNQKTIVLSKIKQKKAVSRCTVGPDAAGFIWPHQSAMLKATLIPADSFEDTSRCTCVCVSGECVLSWYCTDNEYFLLCMCREPVRQAQFIKTHTHVVQSWPEGCVWKSEQQVGLRKTEKMDSIKSATHFEWLLTQTWQVSSY